MVRSERDLLLSLASNKLFFWGITWGFLSRVKLIRSKTFISWWTKSKLSWQTGSARGYRSFGHLSMMSMVVSKACLKKFNIINYLSFGVTLKIGSIFIRLIGIRCVKLRINVVWVCVTSILWIQLVLPSWARISNLEILRFGLQLWSINTNRGRLFLAELLLSLRILIFGKTLLRCVLRLIVFPIGSLEMEILSMCGIIYGLCPSCFSKIMCSLK